MVTSPVKVSSGEGDGIDVDGIVDRVVDAEFESSEEKERFLGGREPPTNLSEHADARRSDEVPQRSEPTAPAEPQVNDD